jgi:hypothetical protein
MSKTEKNAGSIIEELISVKKTSQKRLKYNSTVALNEDGLLLAEKVLIQPKMLTINGTTVPIMFAARVFNKKSRLHALAFLGRVKKLNLTSAAQLLLLRKAGFDGFAKAEQLLKVFEQNKPKGEPKLFIGLPLDFNRPSDACRVALCNGQETFDFIVVQHDKIENWLRAQKLSVNVYGHGTIGPFRISEDEYYKIMAAPQKFFKIMQQLKACSTHVQEERLLKHFRAFFTDWQNAQKELDRLWNEVEVLNERDRLYAQLRNNKILEFSEGYLTLFWNFLIYISKDGKVFRLKGITAESKKRAVYSAIKKGTPPKSVEREHEKTVLKEVCDRLKNIAPELALIILP